MVLKAFMIEIMKPENEGKTKKRGKSHYFLEFSGKVGPIS